VLITVYNLTKFLKSVNVKGFLTYEKTMIF